VPHWYDAQAKIVGSQTRMNARSRFRRERFANVYGSLSAFVLRTN